MNIRDSYKRLLPRSEGLAPKFFEGIEDLAKRAFLDGKTRELIILAVTITRQCDGCIAAQHGRGQQVRRK
ncbi:carboxymuconolactone decarboxylase family protein [Leptospira broomii]|uniref:carboxymuconolactone decarboxylase family protein n=1 Tax=Leptospira broomii TaxID=301541 RepID=UPI0038BD7911